MGSDTQETKTGLSLNVGTTYYFGVKAQNGAGLWSAVGVSDGIAVLLALDTTPPTTPVVTDEGATTTSTSQLYASWSSGDPESGIAEYQYAIGTTSGGTDVVDWTSAGTDTAVTRTELNLTAGTAYCFAVKARNGEGLWSSVGTSDGIIAQKSAVGGNGGTPSWVWIVVGIVGAAVAVIGLYAAIGFFTSRPKPQKPAATDQTTGG